MHQQEDIQTIAKGKAMKTLSRGPKPQEITVVIACVLVLICTVGAIGQRTREHSHQLACYAQMMTLLDGWTQFAEDHDGQLPKNSPSVVHHNGALSWVDSGVGVDAPSNLEHEIESITHGTLFPYIGDVDTYHCPADTRLYDPNQRAFRSYSISNTMNAPGSFHGPTTAWADEIANPASALVFVEEPDPRGSNLGEWAMGLGDQPGSSGEHWVDPVATWHDKACNLGFADGHVERHRWQNQSTIDRGTAAQFADPGFRFNMVPEDGFEDYDYMRSIYEIEFNRRPGYKEPGETRPRN
jgi:prepilin-type processing-associated H-X9-DG protein